MKLTIIAATGGVGREVRAGRRPQRRAGHHRPRAQRLADPTALEPAIAGADAVLSGLGPRSNATLASQGTQAIVAAMQAAHLMLRVVGHPRRSTEPSESPASRSMPPPGIP